MKLINPKGDTDLYCRLSKEQAEKVGSVALQERNLVAECKRLGLRPRAVHVDDGISASNPKSVRPGYLDLVAAIKAGECRNVIAVDMDRFSRQNGEWANLLFQCGKADVKLYARGTVVDASDPNDVLVATILGAVATTDSAIKARKIRDAHEEIRAQGRFHGGRRPFGYESDGATPHADEAPLYRELIARCAKGETPGKIAADWLERGIVGQNDIPFDTGRLRCLVFSPRHSGQQVYKRKVIGTATWEGLVTPEEQARAQAAIRSRLAPRAPRGTGVQATTPAPLIAGLARCALCGTKLVLTRRHGQSYLRCPSTGGTACGRILVNARLADHEVEERFLFRLTQPKVQRAIARQQAAAPEIGPVLARIDKVDADLGMLRDMLAGDEIEAGEYRRTVGRLKAVKEAAEAELAASSLPVAITTDPETLIEKWSTLDVDERRANLNALAEEVTIGRHIGPNRKVWNGERVAIRWADADTK